MIKFYFSTLILISLFLPALLGQSEDDFFIREDTVEDFVGITKYDAFCPILDGDSIRYCGKSPCTGWVKEYYPGTEKLIHEGSYEYGQIATVFTNYFISGKVERSFVKKASRDIYSLQVYDSLGFPITEVEYNRKAVIKRKDYYRGGVLELDELFDKKGQYFQSQRYYYPNGKPYSELFISDAKRNMYIYKEYFPTGVIKIEGLKIRNPEINDYFNHGKWTYYDSTGKITQVENYNKGTLTD